MKHSSSGRATSSYNAEPNQPINQSTNSAFFVPLHPDKSDKKTDESKGPANYTGH